MTPAQPQMRPWMGSATVDEKAWLKKCAAIDRATLAPKLRHNLPDWVAGGLQAQVKRVGGWSMVLSGLVYAGVWVFAPIPVAVAVGCAAVIAGIVVTYGYCLLLRARARRRLS